MEQILFDPADPRASLSQLPQTAAVFALYGKEAHAEPYIGRTPNLRARLERLLQPSARHPRRLQLAGLVRRIAWQLTGSEFESLLAQFSLLEEVYGARTSGRSAENQSAEKQSSERNSLARMHLRAPAFIRYLGGNPYPRIVVTNRPSQREAEWAYGPFASRASAERYAEEALKLFLLRRCTDDLDPNPSHPGCVYSEMKMCLAPCYQGCTDQRYADEAAAVERFLATRGESRLVTLRAGREQASANLEFESAAAIHAQVQKVEAVRALASELVRPMNQLQAVILQTGAQPNEVAVFLFADGRLRGPAAFSTLGMRIQNEQSGSSSLFAHPMAIEPVVEEREQGSGTRDQRSEIRDQGSGISDRGSLPAQASVEHEVSGRDFSRAESVRQNERALAPEEIAAPPKTARGVLESRMEAALATLNEPSSPASATVRQGHLALLKRWYYRPEARRAGEIFFPDAEGRWPVKAMLRGAGRVAAKML
jgi:excinuclease UvrABC nuclease subunit